MALLAEYALTPDVFDTTSYNSDEVCDLHLQSLKDLLLNDGIVRDLRDGEWRRIFSSTDRAWHRRGKELLKKLVTEGRLSSAVSALAQVPASDFDWCSEAVASHASDPLAAIIVTERVAVPPSATSVVTAVSEMRGTAWWTARSPSLTVRRTRADYEAALDAVLRHANSLMFVDPHIDPTDRHQYADFMQILESLRHRSSKPLVELHRASWYGGGNDKRPRVEEVVAALRPELSALAKRLGCNIEVFLWDDIHDRFLISDLIGISMPHGFATTRAADSMTPWTRLGRADRDAVQRRFDPASRTPRHRFTISTA